MADQQRIARVRAALRAAQLDAVVCALPVHVLLLAGYWPVIGTSVAVATADGQVGLIVPADELELTDAAACDHLLHFPSSQVDRIATASELVVEPLRRLLAKMQVSRGRLGFEDGEFVEPSTYASMHVYGGAMRRMIESAAPDATALVPADGLLSRLLAVKTPDEIARIRIACTIAERAFHLGSERLQSGVTEAEAAMNFRLWLSTWRDNPVRVERADGFVFCMSGPNAAQAHRPYQRSRDRVLREGDTVLIHCNNYADGYWTDITRTYCVGDPDDRTWRMYEAVFEARRRALDAAAPGVRAAELYHIMRGVIDRHGFAEHAHFSKGHGVGFHAIHHHARPVLHPASDDVLESGMVFCLVPAIYIEGFGGVRHCDMIAITDDGHEVLTPFQTHPAALQIIGGTY